MRIVLLTIGAMGDTQPFVALAVRLKSLGHSVRLAARPDFGPLAASYGIEFAPLGNPYKSVMKDQDVAAAVGSGNLLKIVKQGADPAQRQKFFERLDTDTLKARKAQRRSSTRVAGFPSTPTLKSLLFHAWQPCSCLSRGPTPSQVSCWAAEKTVANS